jgi:hypothetical protein
MANSIETFTSDNQIFLSYDVKCPLDENNFKYSAYVLNLISDMTLTKIGNKNINNSSIDTYFKYYNTRNYITPWIIGFGYLNFRELRKVRNYSLQKAAIIPIIRFGILYYVLGEIILSPNIVLHSYLSDSILFNDDTLNANTLIKYIKYLNKLEIVSIINKSNV